MIPFGTETLILTVALGVAKLIVSLVQSMPHCVGGSVEHFLYLTGLVWIEIESDSLGDVGIARN
jgi:hypothetical protein